MKKKVNPKILFVTFFIFIFVFSCKKDDQPEYAGSWYYLEEDSDGYNYRMLFNLSENSFEIWFQVQNPADNKFLNAAGIKGNLTVNDDIMTFKITQAGVSSYSSITGLPTGNIEWFTSDDEIFEEIIYELLSIENSIAKAKYTLNGNKLTLYVDLDENGSYNDEDDGEIELTRL